MLALLMLTGPVGCGVSGAGNGGSSAGPIAATAGPQLGYLWTPAEQSLRPILGVPGAAQVGQSVVPAGQYLAAASTNTLALLQDASGFALMALPSGTPVRLGLAPAATASQLRISPGSRTALIFAPGATTATLLTSLSVTGGADVNQAQTLTAPAPILDAVVSDQGSVAALIAAQSGARVSLLGKSGSAGSLATMAGTGSLSFLAATAANPDDLLIADAAANTLTLVHSVSIAPAASTLPTGSLLKTPVAVSASPSGHWAAVANSADPSVIRIDLTGQTQPQRIACLCQPALAAPLADDGAFRITAPAAAGSPAQPTWIADLAATPRTLFIPALAGATSGATSGSAAPASTHAAAGGIRKSTAVKLGVQ